jgi:hypothetical protein
MNGDMARTVVLEQQMKGAEHGNIKRLFGASPCSGCAMISVTRTKNLTGFIGSNGFAPFLEVDRIAHFFQ